MAELILKLQGQDPTLVALRERSDGDDPAGSPWTLNNGLWYFKSALYVPDDCALRAQLLRIHHNDELAGYFGRNKIEALLSRKYY